MLALGEVLAAPIATSLGGRGMIPTRHRLSVGCAGNYAAPPANQIVHEADLVLFIGCHTGDQVTHTWRIPPLDTPCVQIDLDPLELGRSYPNTLGLMGDPKATLAKLLTGHGQTRSRHGLRRSCRRHRAAWREARAPLLAQQCRADLAGSAVRRDHPRAAGGWHPGRRHRLFRHLDLDADRTERRRPDVSTCRRLAGLVFPGGVGCQMRGRRSAR